MNAVFPARKYKTPTIKNYPGSWRKIVSFKIGKPARYGAMAW